MSTTGLTAGIFERLGKIALIGGGKMGEAILAGLVHGALLGPEAIEVAETNEERRAFLAETYGVTCVEDGAMIAGAETVLLAVKPQVFKQVAEHLAAAGDFAPRRVISIAAGVTTRTIAQVFPTAQVIRVMPNAPLMVSSGMSVVAVADGTAVSEGELVVELFGLMGEAVLVDEGTINAATAVSGSGPAYFALLVEELTRAGEHVGLSQELSRQLALQTFIGAARQLQLTGESPEALRMAVTSPGGTTQAALESFSVNGFGVSVEQAIRAAVRRAEELA
jgi:pyrroline-5-carboxylate reductase